MTPDTFEPEMVGRALTDADLIRLKRAASRDRLPRPTKGERYLGGPVPLGWLTRAAALSGKALNLGIALWYSAIRSKRKNPTVALTTALAAQFGLHTRTTRARALAALSQAGLVNVENRTGRAPRVTILAVEIQNDGACETPDDV